MFDYKVQQAAGATPSELVGSTGTEGASTGSAAGGATTARFRFDRGVAIGFLDGAVAGFFSLESSPNALTRIMPTSITIVMVNQNQNFIVAKRLTHTLTIRSHLSDSAIYDNKSTSPHEQTHSTASKRQMSLVQRLPNTPRQIFGFFL